MTKNKDAKFIMPFLEVVYTGMDDIIRTSNFGKDIDWSADEDYDEWFTVE